MVIFTGAEFPLGPWAMIVTMFLPGLSFLTMNFHAVVPVRFLCNALLP